MLQYKYQNKEFYETAITIKVLSDRPLDNDDLSSIIEDADSGDLVLTIKKQFGKQISSKKMVHQLYEFGSEPGFMQLDDNGKSVD
jgi:hypothetical protein